jgi:hypothetical protein
MFIFKNQLKKRNNEKNINSNNNVVFRIYLR